MKIYNIGSLNIDYVYSVEHFVSAGETLASQNMQTFPGGKGLNQSVALARAGAEVVHCALVGKNGGFLVDIMKESGVDVSRIKYSDESDGHAIIQVDKNGQNCILLFGGTNMSLNSRLIEEYLYDAQKGDILLLQNEVNCLKEIFEIAHEKEMQIAFNPSPFSNEILELPLEYVDWWFCNEIEGEALFGSEKTDEIISNFKEKYPDSKLILTLGKKGSIFADAKVIIRQPIFETKAVDTTAAGDTFTGYFLSSIVGGETIENALKKASFASSITVSRKGAAPSIPFADELK